VLPVIPRVEWSPFHQLAAPDRGGAGAVLRAGAAGPAGGRGDPGDNLGGCGAGGGSGGGGRGLGFGIRWRRMVRVIIYRKYVYIYRNYEWSMGVSLCHLC
jgi:hypothetical protein